MIRAARRIGAIAIALAVLAAAAVAAAMFFAEDSDPGEHTQRDEPPRPARLLFAADFTDGLDEFPEQIHPERISVVDDPVL